MIGFFLVMLGLLSLDVYWGWRASSYVNRLKHFHVWRALIGIFISSQLLIITILFAMRPFVGQFDFPLPTWVMASTYVWHVMVLPATILPGLALRALAAIRRRRRVVLPQAQSQPVGGGLIALTRRQILFAGVAAAVPPVATWGLVSTAYLQRYHFRVREVTISVQSLPPNLDGLRIAHLSDTHIGGFTNDHTLRAVTEVTNSLKADVICFTGDLIDFSLRDLPTGFDFFARLDPRHGMGICVGNHDLFQSGVEYRRRMLERRLPLLLNNSRNISIRGESVQLLGLDWGMVSNDRPHDMDRHMARLMPQVQQDGAFPILLAHHPHAMDAAATTGVPLVLSGHTHGGQMNLTDHIGGGPMMFRYWSGLYQKANTRLVVSNGIGSWFPLRVNAPAEIVHLTLRRA